MVAGGGASPPRLLHSLLFRSHSQLQLALTLPLSRLFSHLPPTPLPSVCSSRPSGQLGDGAREMAVTQWLSAFEGTELVVPGFASGWEAWWPGCTRWLVTRRPASARSLATHLLLLRFVVQGLGGVVYIGVRRQATLRLLLIVIIALAAAVSGFMVLCSGGRAGMSRGRRHAADGRRAADGLPPITVAPGALTTNRGEDTPSSRGGLRAEATPTASMPLLLRTRWPSRPEAVLAPAPSTAVGWHCPTPGTPSTSRDASPVIARPQSDGVRHSGAGKHAADAASDCDGRGGTENGGTADLVLPIWQFSKWEVSLTFFIVTSRGIPQQASDTVLAYFSSSTAVVDTLASAIDGGQPATAETIEMMLAPIGSLVWLVTLVYIGRKIYQLPKLSADERNMPHAADSDALHSRPIVPGPSATSRKEGPASWDPTTLSSIESSARPFSMRPSIDVLENLREVSCVVSSAGSAHGASSAARSSKGSGGASGSIRIDGGGEHSSSHHRGGAMPGDVILMGRESAGEGLELANAAAANLAAADLAADGTADSDADAMRPATYHTSARSASAVDVMAAELPDGDLPPSQFSTWMCFLWAVNGVLAASGFLLAVPSWVGTDTIGTTAHALMAVVAIVSYFPYLPLTRGLDILVDAFLIDYGDARAPSIVYWSNVALVLVVWPLLAIKWVVVNVQPEDDDALGCGAATASNTARDNSELGLTVIVTCGLLLLVCLFYTLVDPLLPPSASLKAALQPRALAADRAARDAGSGANAVGRGGPISTPPSPPPGSKMYTDAQLGSNSMQRDGSVVSRQL